MGYQQMSAVTGVRKKPTYLEEINAKAPYLANEYAITEQERINNETLDLQQQQLKESKKQIAADQKNQKYANWINTASVGAKGLNTINQLTDGAVSSGLKKIGSAAISPLNELLNTEDVVEQTAENTALGALDTFNTDDSYLDMAGDFVGGMFDPKQDALDSVTKSIVNPVANFAADSAYDMAANTVTDWAGDLFV